MKPSEMLETPTKASTSRESQTKPPRSEVVLTNLSDRASAQLQSPTARRLQTAAPGRVSLYLRLDLAADLTFGTKEVLLWFPFTPALTLRSVFWFCQFGFCLVFFLLILLDSVFGSFKLHPLESRAPNRSRIHDLASRPTNEDKSGFYEGGALDSKGAPTLR